MRKTTQKNYAFDFETAQGVPVCMGFSDGSILEYPTLDEVLLKLTTNHHKRRFFCYNIEFDTEAFLKYLPPENLDEFFGADPTATIYKDYKIVKLGKNNLTITKGKNATNVWDLAQFYMWKTLEHAAKTYLDLESQKMSTPTVELFKTDENSQEFYDHNRQEINEYCIQDATITAQLADTFAGVCSRDGYDFKKPYSMGNLGIKFFAPYLKHPSGKYQIPRIWNKNFPKAKDKVLEETWETIARGGWNDVFQRGTFYDVYDYDVVSSYPSAMWNLQYWDVGWKRTEDLDLLKDSAYSLIAVNMSKLKRPVIPSMYRYLVEEWLNEGHKTWGNTSVLHCHVDEPFDTVLTGDQYRMIRDYCKIDIKWGIVGHIRDGFEEVFPFREPLKVTFERKAKAKKPSIERDIVKKIMNSTSGKFKQKKHSDWTWFFYPHVYSKITTATKRAVFDLIEKNKAWNTVIAISTDGVSFTKPLNRVKIGKELGDWELTRYDEFTQVGNGIYLGSRDGKVVTQRLRSFKNMDLGRMLRTNPYETTLYHTRERPIHLREAYRHHKIFDVVKDVNRFTTETKKFNINQDTKRKWFGEFENIKDLLSGRILKSESYEVREDKDLNRKLCDKNKNRRLDEF